MKEKIAAYKEQAFEAIEGLKEQGQAVWVGLNPREKLILGGAAGLFGLAILALVLKVFIDIAFTSAHGNQALLQQATQVQKIVEGLKGGRIEARRYDRFLRDRGENFKIQSFLEAEAKKAGVKIEKISPTNSVSKLSTEDDEILEITLANSTNLDSGIRFLRSVEEALGVRIIALSIKPEFSDLSKLDIQATIANKKEL